MLPTLGATDEEIKALTEELYKLDQAFFVGDLITYDSKPPGPYVNFFFVSWFIDEKNIVFCSTFCYFKENYSKLLDIKQFLGENIHNPFLE